jgi:hypothetical protein
MTETRAIHETVARSVGRIGNPSGRQPGRITNPSYRNVRHHSVKASRRTWLLLAVALLLYSASDLRADGGTLRLWERAGNYRVAVFTSPSPLRAGPVDISVFVQDATTGEQVPGAKVMVRLTSATGEVVEWPATTEAATNKLFYAAKFELPAAGLWETRIEIEGPAGKSLLTCPLEAEGPLPSWMGMWLWLGWPAVVVLLFCVHQYLVLRKSRADASSHSI